MISISLVEISTTLFRLALITRKTQKIQEEAIEVIQYSYKTLPVERWADKGKLITVIRGREGCSLV
jgi:hypothetical protein